MKKKFTYFVAAVCAALTFSACSSDKLEAYSGQTLENPESPSNAISFGTYMGKTSTRGSYTGGDITNANLKDAEFGVFAYHTNATPWATWKLAGTESTNHVYTSEANFMYNQQVTYNGTNHYWTYTPVKYWPNGEDAANSTANPSYTADEVNVQKVSFFAYAPYATHSATAYSGIALPDALIATDDATQKVTNAVVANSATTASTGIVAMSKNTEKADPQVLYILNAQKGESKPVDLLWGLRGQKDYHEAGSTSLNTDENWYKDYNIDLSKQTVDEKVNFLFKHALVRVGGNTSKASSASGNQICGVKVLLDIDANSPSTTGTGWDNQSAYLGSNFNNQQTLVTIKGVKIRDKHTYEAETNSSTDVKSDFANYGWFDIVAGKWTNTGTDFTNATANASTGITYEADAQNTSSNLNPDIKEPSEDVTAVSQSSATWSLTHSSGPSSVTGVQLAAKNVYADNVNIPGLMLIPGTSENNTIYVTIEYVVRTLDTNLNKGYTEITQKITNAVTLTGSALKSNKYYTLVMHLGLTSVKFEAVVADWSKQDDPTYTESGEETGGEDAKTAIWLPSNVVNNTTTITVPAGTRNTVNTAAATTTYTINLTGLTAGSTVTPAVTSGSGTSVSAATTADSDGKAAVTVTLTANDSDSATKNNIITITESVNGTSVTEVIIVQGRKES